MGEEDRASILARRARFIATTLAGLAVAHCGDSDSPPQPCLDAPPDTTGTTGTGQLGGGGDAGAGGGAGGEPQPCLIAPLGGGGMGGEGG